MRNHGLLTAALGAGSIHSHVSARAVLPLAGGRDGGAHRVERARENVLAHTAHLYSPERGGPTACWNGRRCCACSTPGRRIPAILRMALSG